MNKIDEDRNLNEGGVDGGEGLSLIDVEGGLRHGNGEFKVIGCCRERKRRCLAVVGLCLCTHVE